LVYRSKAGKERLNNMEKKFKPDFLYNILFILRIFHQSLQILKTLRKYIGKKTLFITYFYCLTYHRYYVGIT